MTESEFLSRIGLVVDSVIADGAIHRVPTRDKPKKKNGWYIAHTYPRRVIIGGNWENPGDRQFWAADGKAASKKEQQHFEQLLKTQRDNDFKEAVTKTKVIIARNSRIAKNEYINKKKMIGQFLADQDSLIFPIENFNGEITGAQRILPNGQKFFIKGSKKQGSFHCFTGNTKIVYFCEGIATAWTVNHATGCQTYSAIDCNNLEKVVPLLSARHRESIIAIAADNDQWKPNNAGIEAALKVKAIIPNVVVLIPKFKNADSQPTDFNDLFCLEGLEETKKQLSITTAAEPPKELPIPTGEVKYEDICDEILKSMRGEKSQFPAFPVKLHLKEDIQGEKIILYELPNKVLRVVKDKLVHSRLARYLLNNEFVYTLPNGQPVKTTMPNQFSAKTIINLVNLWIMHKEELSEELHGDIKVLAHRDDPCYTFNRLDFVFEDGPCPTWDEMMSRTSDKKALMAFIGSIFEPLSDRQQYLWLYGEGGNGKGSIQKFLRRILGSAHRAKSTDNINQFWSSDLVGKRLADFADTNNFAFIKTGLFKQLTGGDPVPVQYKHKDGFDAELNIKTMFSSNEKPEITRKRSDLRRAIFVTFGPIETKNYLPTDIYDAKLWEERAAFLYKCSQVYRECCPNHGTIPVKSEQTMDLVHENEELWYSIVERHFTIHKPKPETNIRDLEYVNPMQFDMIIRKIEKLLPIERRNFKSYLASHGVEYKTVKLADGSTAKRWVNISTKNYSMLDDQNWADDINNAPF